jgi:DNA-binding MarR family transcriptional regulator
LLQRVRTEGAWEEWLAFFLDGIATAAQEAADTAERTLRLFAGDRKKIEKLGRAASSALRLQELLQRNPFIRIRTAAKALKLTIPTVTNALNHLVRLGIVKEVSGKRRGRLFAYSRYVKSRLFQLSCAARSISTFFEAMCVPPFSQRDHPRAMVRPALVCDHAAPPL